MVDLAGPFMAHLMMPATYFIGDVSRILRCGPEPYLSLAYVDDCGHAGFKAAFVKEPLTKLAILANIHLYADI